LLVRLLSKPDLATFCCPVAVRWGGGSLDTQRPAIVAQRTLWPVKPAISAH